MIIALCLVENSEKREKGKTGTDAADTKPAAGRVRPIHSAVILDEGRRYFIDLLPSRFKGREPMLRITMSNPVSGLRNVITVESGEAPYLKKALSVHVEKFYDEKEGECLLLHASCHLMTCGGLEQEDKPEVELAHHSVRFGRRTFFFDPGKQARGKFVRVTEVG